MTKISDNLSKFLLILNNGSLCHKGKSYHYLSSGWIRSNINIPIGALIVSKCKSRQLYLLTLPNTMNNMLLIHKPATDCYQSDLEISFNLTYSRIHPIHSFAVKNASEGLLLFI